MKYFFGGIDSKNTLVNYIFRSAITSNSRLGSNVRYILHKYNVDHVTVLHNGETISTQLGNHILDDWSKDHNEIDKSVGGLILELIKWRDSLEKWLLNKRELHDAIDMLCTA